MLLRRYGRCYGMVRRRPGSCVGIFWLVVGTVGSGNWLISNCDRLNSPLVSGSFGGLKFGWLNRNAEVRSPTFSRRHWLMLVSLTPVMSSRNRSWEVWSDSSVQTKPPTVYGDTMMHGTR